MITYSTSQIAGLVGIHPNTVRFYEEMKLITKPIRKTNGYRVFTELHLAQLQLARLAFRAEVLQSGLRETALALVRQVAAEHIPEALQTAAEYCQLIQQEQARAEEALNIASSYLQQPEEAVSHTKPVTWTRKEITQFLNVTEETLRNWEKNGLLKSPTYAQGKRIYDQEDLKRLKVIRTLRLGNYSLAAILRLLNTTEKQPDADIRQAVDTPRPDEDIISVCDRLITSLAALAADGRKLQTMVQELAQKHYNFERER